MEISDLLLSQTENRPDIQPRMGARSFMENVRIKACGVFTVKELAQECGMASGCFYRKFKKEFGVIPDSWMDAQRIADIKYLLHSTTLTLTEIAKRTGFATPSSLLQVQETHPSRPADVFLQGTAHRE